MSRSCHSTSPRTRSGAVLLALHGFLVVTLGATARAVSAQEALTQPPLLPNRSSVPNTVEVNLTAAPTTLSLVPGRTTPVYAYNGRVPGPTLEAREGDRVIVHFKNDLPDPTTIHWHGLHVPVEADGNPMDLVPPGGSYDYVFDILPGMAGTYWYHPHPHHQTLRQVALGLYGAIIVRAPDDPLPASLPEKLLLLSDNRFKADGTIDIPRSHTQLSQTDLFNGREGDVLFVNGQNRPTTPIRSGEIQRWRVVNAAGGRYYRLALPGHTFLHVGSDAGLFERPVPVSEVLLAPSDRVELLVQGSGAPGSQVMLQSLPYDRYEPSTRPKDWQEPLDLLEVRYASDAPITPPLLPAALRVVPPLDPAKAVATRTINLANGLINGRRFHPNYVNVKAALNTTEVWQVTNRSNLEDHAFHLHGFSFQVLDANGVPIPAWEDNVNVPKQGSVQIIVEFRDYPGKRMFHCHILSHEDFGMMGILEVVP